MARSRHLAVCWPGLQSQEVLQLLQSSENLFTLITYKEVIQHLSSSVCHDRQTLSVVSHKKCPYSNEAPVNEDQTKHQKNVLLL